MRQIDVNFFPGWVRKSLTFTIDDGNIAMDRKFMGYVKPAGIRGTFNLSTPLVRMEIDKYADFYKGYEIANHCKYHAYALTEKTEREIKNELFDPETADKAYAYLTDEPDLYRIHTYAWTYLAGTPEKYLDCVDQSQKQLEEVFGKGKIRGFVWPCGQQKNEKTFELLKQYGFQSIRKTGTTTDSTGFALPADRTVWSYNANYTNVCPVAKLYDEYPDDGELKFFALGVHSKDFETYGKWDDLKYFCDLLGNRPEDFWYASVGEIFDYEDAVKAIEITEEKIVNPSPIDLFIKIDGKRFTLAANSEIVF